MSKFPVINISCEEEEALWKKPLFVFDTSALCRLYSLTVDVRDNMLAILDVLKPDIWIPHRVMLEFDRHRNEELHKPLGMYNLPSFIGKSHLYKELSNYLGKLEKESYRHPQVDKNTVDILKEYSNELKALLEKVRVTIENALKESKEKVTKSIKTDSIQEKIKDLNIGNPFTIDELKNIIREAHVRYTYSIPPGYMDANSKSSVDVFGDLIIWKEIIRRAKEKGKETSIILITQDLKEDWNATPEETSIIPREELLVEFEAETEKKIWMYTISDFLSKLAQHKAGIQELKEPLNHIDRVKMELELSNIPDTKIKIKCPECGRIIGFSKESFDWEWNWYGNQDGHGEDPEIVYVCHSDVQCPHCEKRLPFTFYADLSPDDQVNYVECCCEDNDLLYTPNLLKFICFPDLTIETCCRCGSPSVELNEDGFCPDCMEEISEMLNSDEY